MTMSDNGYRTLICWDFTGRAPSAFYRHCERLMGDGWLQNPANRLLSNTYLVHDERLGRQLAALVELHGGRARRFSIGHDLEIADGDEYDRAVEEMAAKVAMWSKRGPKGGPR
jgi:hypothetical protein